MDPWEATNANSPILILHLPWCKGAAAAQGAQGVKPTLKLICMRPGSPRLVPNPEQWAEIDKTVAVAVVKKVISNETGIVLKFKQKNVVGP